MNITKFIKEEIDTHFLYQDHKKHKNLFHGTDLESAKDIKKYGIDISKGSGGYFGWGFYTAPDFNTAKDSYADAVEDGQQGVVLEFKLLDGANILNTNVPEDFEIWKQYGKHVYDRNLYKTLIRKGIDGLWDNSFEGIVIYNPNVIKLVKIHKI